MRSRLASSGRPTDRNFLLGIFALIFVFGGYIVAATGLFRAPFAAPTRTVSAVFADTADLHPGAPVRVDGVEVGQVSDVAGNGAAHTTTVRMKLKKNAPHLDQNATAALRWRLILGGSYQIELNPGDGPKQGRSETIDLRHTSSQVEVDEVLATLRSDQRAGIRSTLTELPLAFRDQQAPARALSDLADVAPRLGRVVRSVRGVTPERDLRRLVVSASRTVGALDAATDPVRAVVEGGASTFETIGRRDHEVEATISRAAVVLPRIRSTLRDLDRTLAVADPTLRRLLAPASDVAPTARALRPTVLAADRVLTNAVPLLRRLRPAAAALRRAASDGLPLLEQLAPILRRLDERILPDLALPDKTSHRPTYEMIGPTIASFVSVAGGFDSVSHLAALDAVSGEPKVDTSGCSTYLTDLKPGQIATCASLLHTVSQLLSAPPSTRSR